MNKLPINTRDSIRSETATLLLPLDLYLSGEEKYSPFTNVALLGVMDAITRKRQGDIYCIEPRGWLNADFYTDTANADNPRGRHERLGYTTLAGCGVLELRSFIGDYEDILLAKPYGNVAGTHVIGDPCDPEPPLIRMRNFGADRLFIHAINPVRPEAYTFHPY